MRIIWSPLAVDRASEITGYIAQDKPFLKSAGLYPKLMIANLEN